MKTLQSQLLLLLTIVLAGCEMPPAIDNLSDYKNPNLKIEVIHLEAYNCDFGIGVPQDRNKANRLYLQAARAGDPRSMINYAINRYDEMGTEADPVDAFYWIDGARFVTQNTPDIRTKRRLRGVYDSMVRVITPDQIRQVRLRHS